MNAPKTLPKVWKQTEGLPSALVTGAALPLGDSCAFSSAGSV